VEAATDYLIVPTTYEAGTSEEFAAHPPAGTPPVDLGRSLRLERLPDAEAERLMDACMPRGWDPIPTRQQSQRYSFVRDNAPEPERPVFDPDETVLAALALSRLVVPHSAGFEWALRVADYGDGRRRLMPLDPAAGFLGYLPDRTARNWLDLPQAEELRELLGVLAGQGAVPRTR